MGKIIIYGFLGSELVSQAIQPQNSKLQLGENKLKTDPWDNTHNTHDLWEKVTERTGDPLTREPEHLGAEGLWGQIAKSDSQIHIL